MLPPFDVQLSRALAVARSMEHLATIGPVDLWERPVAGRELCFLPSRSLGPRSGLLVMADSYGGSLRYVYTDPLDGQAWITMDIRFNADNTANRFGFVVHMLKGAAAGQDAFLLVTPGMVDEYTRFEIDPASYAWATQVYQHWWEIAVGAPADLAGVSLLPRNDPASDEMTFLAHNGGGAHEEHEHFVNALGQGFVASVGGGSLNLPPEASAAGPGFYHHDPVPGSRRSYFSFYEGGGWHTLSWDESFAPQPLALDRRVDRLLSTGDLYCRGDDGIDRVYGPTGNRKHQFAVGSLRLAYETYEEGVATLYYTLVYWDRSTGSGGDGRMYVRVYRLPTAELPRLD